MRSYISPFLIFSKRFHDSKDTFKSKKYNTVTGTKFTYTVHS